MDLEGILTGENLVFYKNIKDLKVLTANARALITKSHAVFEDILQSHVFNRPVRGTEQQEEELNSLRSSHGECIKCGLQHGAHGFCIVYEIKKAEGNKMKGSRNSAAALSGSLDLHEKGLEDEEPSFAQPTKSPEKSPEDKAKEWENLLCQKMTQEELDHEYSRICYMHGVANGRKFLLARSLAQEPDKVKPLFTPENQRVTYRNKGKSRITAEQQPKSRITSITRDCATEKKLHLPHLCLDISPHRRNSMTSVLDRVLSCESKVPYVGKVWKHSLKPKPNRETIDIRETTEDQVCVSPSITNQSSASRSGWCYCGLDECECAIQSTCNPPEKKCLTVTDYQNNYLFTVREKLRKRRLNKGKAVPAHQRMTFSSGDLSSKVSSDSFRKDSELMVEKAHALHQKQLKNCIESKIGTADANLDKNVSMIADLTSVFTKPDDKAWDQWTEGIREVKAKLDEVDDDGLISGDSDISTSCSTSMTSSTTDREIQHPQPTTRHIPFVEEPLKLVDIFYDKIYTRFRKLTHKSLSPNVTLPYKQFFFSHVANLMPLTSSDFIEGEVLNKLKLYIPHLITLKPKALLKAHRLKRLEGKNKNLSKTMRRRNYIEGIQLGKRYRRVKKPSKFSKDQGCIGFKAEDRKFFGKQSPQMFAACDLVEGGCDVMLSRERIHHHYRLLKTLFNGSMQSGDKESLMDEGMKERLKKFQSSLQNSSRSYFGTDSDTEGEDECMVKVTSNSTRRPLKRNEKKLKTAPGHLPRGTRSYQDSQKSSSRLNESKLFNETYPRTSKTSSYKSSSKGLPTLSQCDPPVTTRALLSTRKDHNSSNRWDDYTIASSLLEESLPKARKNSSKQLSSKQINYPTRFNQTDVSTRTLYGQSYVSKERSNTLSLSQLEPYHLPTPPLSESSCGELDLDFIQHRVPSKEEAHMEKSARINARAGEKQTTNILNPQLRVHDKHKSQQVEESELTDKSSDSYVPKLLKIPPKRTSASPSSLIRYTLNGAASRARIPYLSDSSSSDPEPTNPVRQNRRERLAWDHESGRSRRIAPYLDSQPPATNNLPSSGQGKANYESQSRTCTEKSTFTSLLPEAGPSILKKNSLPKPPSDGISGTQSETHGLGTSPIKRQSFNDSNCQTTSWPSEGLVRPACVVTERLLKATQVNPNVDLPASSTRKHSVQSRVTPDPIIPSVSRKTSAALPDVSKSVQLVGLPTSSTPDVAGGNVVGLRSDSLSPASRKQFSKRASSKIASEVFRRRSIVTPPDQIEKHQSQLKNEGGTKAAENIPTPTDSSIASMGTKLKKLEAISPTRRICFNMDIGQGINCVNYLKENAPGADDMKKKELVDLLVTPVLEVKKASKKATTKVDIESSVMDGAIVSRQQSAVESPSLTSAGNPSQQRKTRAHSVQQKLPLKKDSFKTLDQIYKEVHGINKNNTPKNLVENDYEYEAKKKQQLKKHKISP